MSEARQARIFITAGQRDHGSQITGRESLPATVINISRGGICLATGIEFSPGVNVVIWGEGHPGEPAQIQANRKYSARVKWCRLMSGDKALPYRIGLAFEKPLKGDYALHWRSDVSPE